MSIIKIKINRHNLNENYYHIASGDKATTTGGWMLARCSRNTHVAQHGRFPVDSHLFNTPEYVS